MSNKHVSLDPATLRWVMAECRTMVAATNNVGGSLDSCNAYSNIAYQCDRQLAEAASPPPALWEWIRACEGTGLGEPLNWWDDGLDGLDLAAEWFAAGKRVIAYCGPNGGGPYVEVDGEVHTRCATPADLRAALERIAAEAGR